MTASLLSRLLRSPWGAWSLVSLYISIGSGIIVALQYDPANPYHSAASMDLLVPFGQYFRSLHFYSSQAFFLFACVHLAAVYPKTNSYSATEWAKLIFGMVAGLLLLFTGYILRGDSTGSSAGMIAESIITTIPLVGSTLNTLFFSVSEHGMQRVYVHHLITLDLLWLMLAWDHLRRYRVRASDHLPLICLTFIFCLAVAAPIEPDRLGVTYIAGPWFFLGLQELLRYLPPLIAGVIVPALLVVALLYARYGAPYQRTMLGCGLAWFAFYGILTAVAWLR